MITIQNMPYISLIWTGVGFFIMLISIIVLAYQNSKYEEQFTEYSEKTIKNKAEELFSYFLEEEKEKKEVEQNVIISQMEPKKSKEMQQDGQYDEIIRLYDEKMTIEDIAKQMKMGVGEVQLFLTLYLMR
ncbi:MAG: DUF6115 domain-containing protein [Cellulosilyticaceae bacterium]